MKSKKKQPFTRVKANIDDIVEFERHGLVIRGRVVVLRPETVIIEFLDQALAVELEYGNNRTVVRDENYVIIEKSDLPPQPIFQFNGWQRPAN
jgi:uncharacterized protein YkvS